MSVRAVINYGVSPVFFGLAIVNYFLEKGGAGHHVQAAVQTDPHVMHAAAEASQQAGMIAGSLLGSMWLMYGLMGLAHILPWLSIKDRQKNS